jgi:DNA-binding transcriptional LysR family regulator/predicted ATPase
MELEARLRAFAAVARAGSFSRAAETLYVSQPAVSKHVAALEAELARKLVVRDRRGATLTPAGHLLADYVLRAEALLANGRRALAAGTEETGTLALAASGVPGNYLLPELLARFKQRHPGVSVALKLSTSAGALELARAHQAELAIVGGFVVPPELEAEPLVDDEIVLVGPPHLAGRRLRPRDLEGLTWISREEGSATKAAVEAARWQLGIHQPETLELPSWEAVKRAVASGGGIAAISRRAVDVELEAGTLAVLDVARWRLVRTISVVRARDVPLTPPAQRFLRLLQETHAPREERTFPGNSNLRLPQTTLVGRGAELSELTQLLRLDGGKLVTLTGPAGSGKTRLAVEAAARLVDSFPDGVYFVDLSAVPEAALVSATIASALGIREPDDLAESLRDKRVLLVLDNFEHVVDAAPEIAELRRQARQSAVLVTSRVPLRIQGERIVAVEPLPDGDAVELFVDRACEVDPKFRSDDSVPLLCEQLDRLPLALELVASRAGQLPPRSLLDGLHPVLQKLASRDAPERHRTLQAAIGWSYDLLDEASQAAFRRLSVFRGGWTVDTARAVCSANAATIAGLAEHSLVLRDADGRRFRMLETIREFAGERLAEQGEEEEARRLHGEHVLDFAERAREGLDSSDRATWLDAVGEELGNVRAALIWAEERRDFEYQLRVVSALAEFWWSRGPTRETLDILRKSLEHVESPTLRADGLRAFTWLLTFSGNFAGARAAAEERRRLAEQLGDMRGVVGSIGSLAAIAEESGELASAEALLEEAVHRGRQIPIERPDIPGAMGRFELNNLGGFLMRRGELERARSLFEQLVREAREQGDLVAEAHGQGDLAHIALLEGRFQEALPALKENLLTWHRLADLRVLAYALASLAFAYGALGDAQTGATIEAAATSISERIEIPLVDLIRIEAYDEAIAKLDPAVLDEARRRGAAMTVDEAVEFAAGAVATRGR